MPGKGMLLDTKHPCWHTSVRHDNDEQASSDSATKAESYRLHGPFLQIVMTAMSRSWMASSLLLGAGTACQELAWSSGHCEIKGRGVAMLWRGKAISARLFKTVQGCWLKAATDLGHEARASHPPSILIPILIEYRLHPTTAEADSL
jgi:hypothetical protein